MASSIEQKKQSRLVLLSQQTTMVTRGLNASNQSQFDKLSKEIADLESDIALLETIEKKLETVRSEQQPKVVADAAATAVRQVMPGVLSGMNSTANVAEQRARINRAYHAYFRTGNIGGIETRDVLVSGSGYALVPQGFDESFATVGGYAGPIASLVKKNVGDNAANHKFVTSDDSATTSYMSLVTEANSAGSLDVDPTVKSDIVNELDNLVTMIKYSIELESDAFDLSAFLADVAATRVFKSLELAILAGKDRGGNVLPNMPTGGFLSGVPTGATTTSLANKIGYQDFVNLYSSVSREFALRGSWMVSNTTFNFLLSLTTTTDNRPLFSFDAQSGLLTILGRPLYVASDVAMGAYTTANTKAVLFGDFSKAFAYSANPLQIKVLRERYLIDSMERAALIYQRVGGVQLLPNAVKALVTAAS